MCEVDRVGGKGDRRVDRVAYTGNFCKSIWMTPQSPYGRPTRVGSGVCGEAAGERGDSGESLMHAAGGVVDFFKSLGLQPGR